MTPHTCPQCGEEIGVRDYPAVWPWDSDCGCGPRPGDRPKPLPQVAVPNEKYFEKRRRRART